MTWQSIAELAVLALVWLAGFCTAGALHQEAADGRFVKRGT